MNKKQRIVLFCGVLIVEVMLLIPPWEGWGVYSPQWMPPKDDYSSASIDVARLWTQIGIVALVSVALILAFKDKR